MGVIAGFVVGMFGRSNGSKHNAMITHIDFAETSGILSIRNKLRRIGKSIMLALKFRKVS